MKLEEEKIDELTKKEEYERIKAQLNAKRVEEERKIAEEKRWLQFMVENGDYESGDDEYFRKTNDDDKR